MSTKKKIWIVASCVTIILGCTAFVASPNKTSINVLNNLGAASIDICGTTTDISGINLAGVIIGDVYFATVSYGTSTNHKSSKKVGEVAVSIDTAIVETGVLGETVSLRFTDINPMSVNIKGNKKNTIVLDTATARVIFMALAKKRNAPGL